MTPNVLTEAMCHFTQHKIKPISLSQNSTPWNETNILDLVAHCLEIFVLGLVTDLPNKWRPKRKALRQETLILIICQALTTMAPEESTTRKSDIHTASFGHRFLVSREYWAANRVTKITRKIVILTGWQLSNSNRGHSKTHQSCWSV